MRASWNLSRPCTRISPLGSRWIRPSNFLGLSRAVNHLQPPGWVTHRRGLLTLAIESSCDDTCVAILSKGLNGSATLHFNKKLTSDNRLYGGVEPMVAVRGHTTQLGSLVQEALRSLPAAPDDTGNAATIEVDGQARTKPDFISVTRGPGMRANLGIGLEMAKGLSVAWQIPLLGVNHMQAHALTPRLVSALEQGESAGGEADHGEALNRDSCPKAAEPEFPFLSLLISGGHTLLVYSRSIVDHQILAQAHNIAIGNVLDHCARVVLPADLVSSTDSVMYGQMLERFAFPPNSIKSPADYDYQVPVRRVDETKPIVSPYGWALGAPLALSREMVYNFSALNGDVQKIVVQRPDMDVPERMVLAKAVMKLAFEHLASRVMFALAEMEELKQVKTLVVAGGVASNRFLMHVLREILDARGFGHIRLNAPPVPLCTDNAAMIAWTGMEMWEQGWRTSLSSFPVRKWPIDPRSEGGILGIDGWERVSIETR